MLLGHLRPGNMHHTEYTIADSGSFIINDEDPPNDFLNLYMPSAKPVSDQDLKPNGAFTANTRFVYYNGWDVRYNRQMILSRSDDHDFACPAFVLWEFAMNREQKFNLTSVW